MFADDAAHPADWFHWIFGKPVSVIAEIDNVITNVAPDDNGVAVYRFGKGEMGIMFNSSTVRAAENTTEIYGDKGVLIQNYGDAPSCAVPKCPEGPALKVFRYDTNAWDVIDLPVPPDQGKRIQAVPRPWIDALCQRHAIRRHRRRRPYRARDGPRRLPGRERRTPGHVRLVMTAPVGREESPTIAGLKHKPDSALINST